MGAMEQDQAVIQAVQLLDHAMSQFSLPPLPEPQFACTPIIPVGPMPESTWLVEMWGQDLLATLRDSLQVEDNNGERQIINLYKLRSKWSTLIARSDRMFLAGQFIL